MVSHPWGPLPPTVPLLKEKKIIQKELFNIFYHKNAIFP